MSNQVCWNVLNMFVLMPSQYIDMHITQGAELHFCVMFISRGSVIGYERSLPIRTIAMT